MGNGALERTLAITDSRRESPLPLSNVPRWKISPQSFRSVAEMGALPTVKAGALLVRSTTSMDRDLNASAW